MGIGWAAMGLFGRRRCLGLARLGLVLSGVFLALSAGPAPSANAFPPTGTTGTMAAIRPAPAVIPFPGTPDASPRSQIIFSSVGPSQLSSVLVLGSRSGRHTGHLVRLPDGAGAAFVPARPFTPPESVRVTAVVKRGSSESRLAFSFGVAAPVSPPSQLNETRRRRSSPTAGSSGSGSAPVQHFRSQPNLHPPIVQATSNPDGRSGDIFLTPEATQQHGPMIVNSQGRLIWFQRVAHRQVYNLEVRRYEHSPVLTWWEGKINDGHGVDGEDIIMDRHYRTVAVLHAGEGYSSDLHEFQLTRHGTALIDSYVPVRENLTSEGGPANGVVYDCVIQELDVRTGSVLWEWHSLGHVPLSASYVRPPRSAPYDYFHLNSIQPLPGGRLLVSARQTWAVYLIDKQTGRIMWTLGGKDSDFRIKPGAQFEWQHDARLHGHGLLTVFDDGIREEPESAAKELHIDTANRTVSLIAAYEHTPPLTTGVQGSMQLLPNHNVFVAWGNTPNFSEYRPDGHQIFNGSFVSPVSTYRAYRFTWHGQPTTRPALALRSLGRSSVTAFASWNGATNVAAWRLLGGPTADSLQPLARVKAGGFETAIKVHSSFGWFAVQAIGPSGRILGRSAAVGRQS